MTQQKPKISLSLARTDANRVNFMPRKISNMGMITYLLAMMACTLAYSRHILDWKWWIFGMVSVLGFFYFANRQTKIWINLRPAIFAKKLFWSALALRVVWVLISYLLYNNWTGTPFSIDAADELFYDEIGRYGASLIRDGDWNIYNKIIYNLCDNAIRYNVDGGRVDVTVGKDNSGSYVEVKDTGIGIPHEHQSRIFERFYRVDKSHSKATGGTGLGLSIVKHAVQYHSGKITLESEAGKGTKITVTF